MSTYTKIEARNLYTAEDGLRWALKTSQDYGSVTVNGVPLTLEPEARFGDLEAVQAYVDRVLAMPSVIAEFGRGPRVTVRRRKTGHAAHYRLNTIAIYPEANRDFFMRETVVLHELAHHFARGDGHGARFAAAQMKLYELVMGPQVALATRILFDQHDVPVS